METDASLRVWGALFDLANTSKPSEDFTPQLRADCARRISREFAALEKRVKVLEQE